MSQQSRRSQRDLYVRMAFRQLPGAVWTTDRELRLTYAAGRLVKNVSPNAKVGRTVFDVLGTRDPVNPVIARHRAALSGESQSFRHQFGDRWYEIFIEPLVDDSGEITGCIAAAFDITEQQATHERLKRSEALLEQAQQVAHIGSFE